MANRKPNTDLKTDQLFLRPGQAEFSTVSGQGTAMAFGWIYCRTWATALQVRDDNCPYWSVIPWPFQEGGYHLIDPTSAADWEGSICGPGQAQLRLMDGTLDRTDYSVGIYEGIDI
jgi:hypothetical protein